MGLAYVSEQGALIRRSGRRLVVEKAGNVLEWIQATGLDALLLFGNIQITTQALALLLDSNTDVAFFTSRARLRGRLSSNLSGNVFQRLAQYDRWRDTAFRAGIARSLVRAKIQNMSQILRHYQHNHPEANFEPSLMALERAKSQIASLTDASSIMGLEGGSSAAYFRAFARMFRKELRFDGRVAHPAPDPVNALLSLGYVLVTNEISGAVEAASLDPFLGFLHGIRYGRKSLALDLVEQFRQPLIDQFTLNLANLGVFSAADFEVVPGEGSHLTETAFREYIRRYEARLREPAPTGGKNEVTWRDLLRLQVDCFRRCMLEGSEYEPFVAR